MVSEFEFEECMVWSGGMLFGFFKGVCKFFFICFGD